LPRHWACRSPRFNGGHARPPGDHDSDPVDIVNATPSNETGPTVVIQITAAGPRIEGLTVEAAARLLTLLR
jgi:hypothetical protein